MVCQFVNTHDHSYGDGSRWRHPRGDTLANHETFTLSTTNDDYVNVTPEHDAAGNLTYDGRFAYTYDDARNRQG